MIQLHRAANEKPAPFVDHHGTLRDARTGRPINGYLSSGEDEDEEESEELMSEYKSFQMHRSLLTVYIIAGYSFFDSGDVAQLGRERTRASHHIGK